MRNDSGTLSITLGVKFMPIAHINIMEGRTDEQKEAMVAEVTSAISRTIGAPEENIRVLIHDVPKQNWGIGGTSAKKLGR
tara:strand:- start:23907 stop:24146 length:240 start_codon:yes stop_codon:yes gene_type:complete